MIILKQSIEAAGIDYTKKYDYLEESCIRYKRLCKMDLIEYCTRINIELS